MNRMFGRVDVYMYIYIYIYIYHDSRILRESAMFADFERVPKITSGLIL